MQKKITAQTFGFSRDVEFVLIYYLYTHTHTHTHTSSFCVNSKLPDIPGYICW